MGYSYGNTGLLNKVDFVDWDKNHLLLNSANNIGQQQILNIIQNTKSFVASNGVGVTSILNALGINVFGDAVNENMVEKYIKQPKGIIVTNSACDGSNTSEMIIYSDKILNKIDGLNKSIQLNPFDDMGILGDLLGFFNSTLSQLTHPLILKIENSFRSPEGMITDHKGNIWVADKKNNRIVRIKYNVRAQSKDNDITIEGYLCNLDGPIDVSFYKNNNEDVSDDKIFIITSGNNSIYIVNPYFSGYNNITANNHLKIEAMYGKRFNNLKTLCMGYNATNVGNKELSNILYIVENNNVLVKMKYTGDRVNVVNKISLGSINSEITSIRSTDQGEIVAVDNQLSALHFITSNLEILFSIGHYGGNSLDRDIQFNQPRYIAVWSASL
jgi:hypothetical protein